MSTRRLFVGLLLTLASIGAGRVAAAASWTVPGTVNASGLNGTKFVSDVTLTNPGTAPAQAVVSFLPASGVAPRTLSLAPGQTVVSLNVVSSLFGLAGVAGALSISSDQALLVRARTYNASQTGTYGVALPVFADDRLLSPGDSGDALWISQDAAGSSGYRTNIALVFPDPTGGAATVTVYDADGIERGHQDYSLEVPGLQQFSVGSFAGAVSVARAQVTVTRGRAAGYAVVVDNVTGDSSLFAFEDLPGGRQDVLVNGVARANGRNNAFFRTDGRLYNPTDTEATIKVSFHASGNANPSPATASFTLPSGKIRDVVDVLDSLLGLPVGSAGALRFESDWPVAILCRTSNVDPTGANPGTFGAQQKPVPVLSFLTSADAGAAITGIRQDTAFRTNVGFAAGADGASYALTLATADGTTVATTTASLGAFGWAQPGIQDLFPTVTIPPDATLRVKVTAGSLDAFDSSIDNLSGDPVVTPIATLPLSIPSSATIGPQGGSIRSDDGRLTLRVPAGALMSSVTISVETNPSNEAPQGMGASYRIFPGGLSFAKAATLVFQFDSEDLAGSASGALGLAFQSGGRWFVATGGAVSGAARTLTVPITSTATVTASTSPHPLAETSPEVWAPFSAFRLYPARKTILTNQSVSLVVYTVGLSSSASSYPGSSPLSVPVNPNEVTYSWYVNGVFLGNSSVGSITDFDQSARYTAPDCPPPGNPVSVVVRLRDEFGRSPAAVLLFSTVRILPRDWLVTARLEVDIRCPNEFLYASLHGVFSNSMLLHVTDYFGLSEGSKGVPEPYSDAPVKCAQVKGQVDRISEGKGLNLWLASGAYDTEKDVFVMSLGHDVSMGVFQWTDDLGYPHRLPEIKWSDIIDIAEMTEGRHPLPAVTVGVYTERVELSLRPVASAGCH
ncbi:MAG: hypothetical protein NEA02_10715 [Thermoanaerobaculia bacterium]|nr:hypothetical protein [Thermoanaerobaculia bacterium]